MAPIPVYMRSLGARITKLTSEFLWSPSSSAADAAAVDTGVAVVPDRVPERDWYPSPSVAPAVTVDTVVYDRVSSTEDVPDRVSSTEDAPVSVGCLEEEFQSVALQDKNKANVDVDDLKEDNIEWDSPVREAKPRKNLYPQNSDAADCSNYLWTGSCRSGSNCGYTHPPKKENQAQRSASSLESAQKIIKEKEKEDLSEQKQQQECEPGGCKFGKACRYRHPQEEPLVPPPLDYNFLGLPIRPGKKECLYYMRDGSCKDGPNCRFHHPEPTAVGEGDVPSSSVSLHPSGASQLASTSCSSPPNETVAYRDSANLYVPTMLPPQGVHPNPEWNGFQGEKEFLYYMCDDSSKHGPNCCFHHPDPICVGRGDVPFGSVSVQPSGASQRASTSWCSPPNETVPYLDAANPYVPMMLPPQGVHPNPEWDVYQGERECLYYMRDDSYKYGPNCSFHHPDPTCVRRGDVPFGSVSVQPSGASQLASTSWSSPPNEMVPYLDATIPYVSMMLPPQGVHPNSEWNVYQASSRPDGTQPLFAANFNPLDWSKPNAQQHQTSILASQRTRRRRARGSNKKVKLKNKLLQKVMAAKGIKEAKLKQVTEDCYIQKPRVPVKGTWCKDAKKTKIVHSARCEICKIDCKSKNVLDQHKFGKKHKTNLVKVEELKKETSAKAAKDPVVCPKESLAADKDKTVSVQQGKDQHKWVKKNLEKVEESNKETGAKAAKDPVVCPKESLATDKGKTVGVKQGNEKGATSLGPGEDLETLILQSAWCEEICRIDCKSKNVLDQHKFGKKHKTNLVKVEELKKETSAKAAKDPVVCPKESLAADKDKTVSVQQGKDQHKWVKKNLEKVEESNKETSAKAAKDLVVCPKESLAADKGKTVGVKQGNEKGATSLGSGEDLETLILQSAWCEICKIDCKSKNVLDQHKFGKKHKTNLVKVEELKKETSAKAAKDPVVCPKESLAADKDKTVSVQQGKDQHKWVKKSLEKVEESNKETSAKAAKDPVVCPKESLAADKGKTVGVKQGNEKGATSLGPGEDLETLILQSAWCEICKIDCKSKNVLDQHKFGNKHKKNLEKVEKSNIEASAPAATVAPVADKGKTKKKGEPSLWPGEGLETQRQLMEGGAAATAVWMCRICNVTCNSQKDYTSHLAGKKHANMVLKQAEAAGTTNPSDSWGGFYFLEDELP